MTNSRFLSLQGTNLHYRITGSGKSHLLLFHGFGQDASAFRSFADSLSREYTVYSFDLYFHGASSWREDETPLEKTFLESVISQFLKGHSIAHFSIAAYSLGAKFALAIVTMFPEKIKALTLIAPDGIKTNFWYSMATYPLPLRKLFKSMVTHPTRFTTLVHTLQKMKIMDASLARFAETRMDTMAKRKKVYASWVVFRRLTTDVRAVASAINKHRIALTVFAGKHDRVIPPENMNRLLRHVRHYRFEILESGHSGLIRQAAARLTNN